ncbi:hypothetical protein BGZ99_002629 [Dissophora globulifera]|uniref:Carbonic anhydrase n=1 Tax=Dissophora globulifera TaxID=979702 RepID=A0A9P6UJ04_9FUNG|nr:hypothetical protein BGZ99_002629 [Dissophora globulifera]
MAAAVRASGAGTVVISCSDPRLNPYQVFGVDPSIKGLTMVRNAGGRALDSVRTISALQAIGNPRTVIVMHHTDCGMIHYNDEAIRKALLEFAPQEKATIEASKYGEITGSPGTRIIGVKYDLNSGVCTQVLEGIAGTKL